MRNSRVDRGRKGEDVALKFLMNKGYRVVDRNFRWRGGEIDIIVKKKHTLVFVEVRSFSSDKMEMDPVETIGPAKVNKLLNTALLYVESHPEFHDYDLRFDVIGVKFNKDRVEIRYIENAIRKE